MFPHTSWPPAQATEPSQNVWIEFAKWVLRDHHRCAWAFATVVVVLLATVTAAGLLAPYLGDLGGLLGGGIVGGGLGLGGGLVARRTRRLTPGEE